MRWPFGAKEKEQNINHNASRDSRTFLLQKQASTSTVQVREEEEIVEYKYAPKQQDEEQPMDLGTLQDIFSFSFMRGRPILNFILAILWSVGLPVLLYNILKPHTGQVLAMVIASAPPLAIVIM
ncbi:hypothetical protein RMATCC62417_13248 [Rhizopus microsporus]|nr:hypothetical protein RMATCC62417_13248 [Rhizopus microsporus]